MAFFCFDVNGVGTCIADPDNIKISTVPSYAASTIAFDPATNADLRDAFAAHCDNYTNNAGQMLLFGVPVTINADGATKNALDNMLNQAAQALTDNTNYLAIADTATAAQVRSQVKALTQQIDVIIRRLVLLGRKIA